MPAISRTVHLFTCSCCEHEGEWGPGWLVYEETPKASREMKKYLDPEPVDFACPKPECQAWIRAKYATKPRR